MAAVPYGSVSSEGDQGEVAEWSKANDSKSFEGKPSVGSNPTLSVVSKFWDGSDCPNSFQ